MARVITYDVECPTCKTQGVTRMLGLDPDRGGITCEAEPPHIFETLPGLPESKECRELEVSAPAQPVVETQPTVSGESEQARFSEIMKERGSQPADSPQTQPLLTPEQTERLDNILADKKSVDERRGREIAANLLPKLGIDFVRQGEQIPLPGGDILFGLRISEQWIEAIRGHAEAQGQSFAEYMQDFINNTALLYEWSSSSASAK